MDGQINQGVDIMAEEKKRGDVVTIYEDPVTRHVVEGQAELIRQVWDRRDGKLEYWTVRFQSDGFVGDRFI